MNEVEHLKLRWEAFEEDGQWKVRVEHAALRALDGGEALIRVGAAHAFAAFSFAMGNAKELAQHLVDAHNATLPR